MCSNYFNVGTYYKCNSREQGTEFCTSEPMIFLKSDVIIQWRRKKMFHEHRKIVYPCGKEKH